MALFSEGLFQTVLLLIFFHLNKPAAISAEKWHYEGIEDAEVVIEDVTAGIKDTLRLIVPRKGDGVFYLNYWNYRTQKEEEVMMSSQEWLRGHGIYVTTKIYGIEDIPICWIFIIKESITQLQR